MSKPAKQQVNPHYPKLTQQQQLLSVAIERDCQYLLATTQVYVSKALKQFGHCLPTPWLLGIARHKILHWQRKQTQESKRITPIREINLAYQEEEQITPLVTDAQVVRDLVHQHLHSAFANEDRQLDGDIENIVSKDDIATY